MALIAIAAVQAAFDVGLMIYRLLNRPKVPLPPLRDLQVMTSTNGAPIPFGYGTCRVAGNVIWSPGITYTTLGKKANAGVALGPKGSFVFRASVAVAFGEGPGTIKRIWADSKLIYDADPGNANATPVSDWPAWSSTELYNPGNQVGFAGQVWQCLKTNTNSPPSQSNTSWEIISTYPPWDINTEYLAGDVVTYNGVIYVAQLASNNGTVGPINPASGATQNVGNENVLYWITLNALYPAPTIYPGDQLQNPDSLIQASETVALTPAFRGTIYAVWENFPLTNFADRIPSFRAEVTYTKTTNFLSNYGVPSQLLDAAFNTSTSVPLQPLAIGSTVIVLSGFLVNNDDGLTLPGGLFISDTQGNTYTTIRSSGPLGREASSAYISYANASPGPNTVNVSGALSNSAIRIVVIPGTWVPDLFGAWTDDLEHSSGNTTLGFSHNPGELLVACFASGYTRPGAIHGDNPLAEPGGVKVTLDTPAGSDSSFGGHNFASVVGTLGPAYPPTGPGFAVTDSWSFFFDNIQDGGAGVWATFAPPSTPPTTAVIVPKPDVLHDICERAGLTDAQIDNTLCAPVNIFSPLTPSNLVPGYLIDHPTPAAKILEVLMHAYFFDACETNGTMKFVPRGLPAVETIPEADLGLLQDMAKIEEQIAQEQDLPKQFTVTHNDPTMDYQQNKQLKGRNVRIVKTKQQTILEIPMTMTSDWARQVAEKALYLSWLERSSYKTNLWRASYLLLDPTDVIDFVYEALTFQMRVAENSVGQGRTVALQGVSEFAEIFNSMAVGGAAAGVPPNGLQIAAVTVLFLFDIPLLRDVDSNPQNSGFYYGMSSASLTWPGGVLFDSTDDVNFLQESASTQPVTYGFAKNGMGAPRSPWTWDSKNTLTVQLIRGSFAGDTPLNVLNGSNALIVGNEIIQFTTAVQNADGTWTLSGLLRGRRGTEWAIGSGAAGDLVVMPSTGVQRIQDPLAVVNQLHFKKAVTNGQDPTIVAPQSFTIVGNDLKPYAPVHIAGTRDGGNNLKATWVRRTRVGWSSLSQDPVPLSEDSEAYSIDIMSGPTVVRTLASSSPSVTYSATDQVLDFGSPQSSILLNVYQLSAQVGRGFVGAATV